MRLDNPSARFMDCTGADRRASPTRIAFAAVACSLLAAASADLLIPRPALAQDGAARPCTEIELDADRLACYDRALRPARPAAAEAPVATATAAPAAEASAVPAAAAAAAAATTAAAVAQSAPAAAAGISTARTVEPRSARGARAEGPAAEPGAPPAPPAAVAAAAPPKGAGAEADNSIVPIVIVGVRNLAGRNDKAFTTDNGVIWLQTDNAARKFPDPPFNAEIKPGMMGSYFLVMDGGNRAIRVRRQN